MLLGVGNTDRRRDPWDLPEIPVYDLEGRAGGRRRPVTEELGRDGKCRCRHGAGVREPLDSRAMRDLGSTTDSVGDEHRVVAVLESLDRREREADLGVE